MNKWATESQETEALTVGYRLITSSGSGAGSQGQNTAYVGNVGAYTTSSGVEVMMDHHLHVLIPTAVLLLCKHFTFIVSFKLHGNPMT